MCGILAVTSGAPVNCACIPPPPEGACAPTQDGATACFTAACVEAVLAQRGPDRTEHASICVPGGAQLSLCGTLLQLRGDAPGAAIHRCHDGSLLCFNGEVFGGVPVSSTQNDGAVLLGALSGGNVAAVLSCVRGPWAVVFWHAPSSTLWFGRDVLGRRSLLVRRPDEHDPRLVLSSVAPSRSTCGAPWEELPPGLYSVQLGAGSHAVEAHAWQEPELRALAQYTRSREAGHAAPQAAVLTHADRLLHVLDAAVALRVTSSRAPLGHPAGSASVLVLFSGGVDSCILAALAHRHVPAGEPIDLANVCFRDGASADRLAALSALAELQALAPTRAWRLIAVEGTLEGLAAHREHLLRLLAPRGTVMDLNIGSALWLAARGRGVCNGAPFTSGARIVLLGTGADEQAAGYSRHRATFVRGGDAALEAELVGDVRRLWYRNLGRDDRLVSDCGREARFPFLDEAVVACLAEMPLHAIANLTQPAGTGDKHVLRAVAHAVGLRAAAVRVKRAIQFGCGVSSAANVHDFGSGRAANARGGGKCAIMQ